MKTQLCTSLLVLVTVLTSVAQRAQSLAPAPCCRNMESPTAPLSDRSIYQVESTWTNAAGRRLRLVDLQGKPQIVAMFFTHCQSACPVLVHDMQQIESALPATLRSQVGFTLISFDTERDSPGVLDGYAKQHSLALGRWTLLRGKADDVLEVAALLGVKFKKDSSDQFAHSNVITLLNGGGEIVKQQIGLGQSGQEMVKAIEQIATPVHPTGSSADQNSTGGQVGS